MHSLRLEYYVLFLCAVYVQAADPRIPIWTELHRTLDDEVKLEKALIENNLPNDGGSLEIIATFIQKRAPKPRVGSPCCLRKNIEVDPILANLIKFHTQQVGLLKSQPENLSEDERDGLANIERSVAKMPKKIRRSYEDLPNLD